LLLLQVWPQYRVFKLLIVLFQDREDQKKYHEKKAKHDKDITCLEPYVEAVPTVLILLALFFRNDKNPNYIKVHNTYYNNMVCYINNKQSDTDSHQSKVKAGRLTAKSVQSLQSALAEEQRGGSAGDGRLLLSKMESKELGVDDCAACSQCDNCCCSCWTAVMMLLVLILGLVYHSHTWDLGMI